MALTDEQVEVLFGKFDSLTRQLHKLSTQLQVFLDASSMTDPVKWKKWLLLNQKAQLHSMKGQYTEQQVSQWQQEVNADWEAFIIGGMMSLNNSFVLVKFSDGVYGDGSASGPVEDTDFNFRLRQNGSSSLTAVTLSSITRRNGDPLTGGEKIIRLNLTLTGSPTGVETVEIRPRNDNSIFNEAGLPTPIEQTTGEVEFFES